VQWPAQAQAAPLAPAAPAAPADDIVAMAERAASEIRENAMREAERIRAGATTDAGDRVNELRALIQRQRESLAALSAEADRVEQSSAILRSQARALASELDGMLASVDAARLGI
jgi:vacuolar-type H+-ATPase subunit E/Vma4